MTESANACLHVETCGAGPPLLMVHGWPFDHRIFQPQIDDLSADFRIVAFDRRGFGRSGGEPSLAADVEDMAAILAARNIGSAHILGMSQGGRIALRFAAAHPGMVRSLILQAPAVDGFRPAADPDSIPMGEYAAWARAGDMQRVREAWLRHPMVASGIDPGPTREFLHTLLAAYTGKDLLEHATGGSTFMLDVAAAVAAARIPVLILTGVLETPSRRQHAEYLRERVPDAVEVLLTNSGHLSNLTEAAAFNRAVRDFCARVEKNRPASAGRTHD